MMHPCRRLPHPYIVGFSRPSLGHNRPQSMPVRARTVANEFIRLSGADARALTPLQVIKLVYIAHGYMLALYQRPLITDAIEAWKYGPVIPRLYHALKQYGAGSITEPIPGGSDELDEDERDVIKQVYEAYGHLTGIQLSQMTHQRGTPWYETWSGEPNEPISNDLIADHYRQLADEQAAAGE
jgi:uncharacterized phage-associated protein